MCHTLWEGKTPWKKSCDQPRENIKKQRHYLTDEGPSSQSYGFSSSDVWVWKLNHKESWVPKNWCFWIVVLEKTLESPLDSKESKRVIPKGNQPWLFIRRTDAEASKLWPPDAKNSLIGKDLDAGKDQRQEKKGTTKDEMVGWYHQMMDMSLSKEGQGSLVCCSPWGRKELDTTEWLN